MKRKGDQLRRYASVGISLLMLTLSVAVPVLGRADLVDQPVAESEHNPGECPPGHDHTVCTQVGANLSALSESHAQHLDHVIGRLALPIQAPRIAGGALEEGHPSRAPPLA